MAHPDLNATSAQTAFNDLRLPVLWIEDEKNPGKLDTDEIYVHPSFWAANEVLKAEGKKPIPVEKIIAAGLKYIKTPKGKQVRHPLLTKDLATRAEPIMDFDVASIADVALAEATRLAVQNAALADVYHRTQVEPQYLEQLRAVVETGDAQKIHHFFLRGWIGCIDKDTSADPLACNPVPNGKRTPNGVWYPAEWTQATIETLQKQFAWPSPELKRAALSPHSRIVKTDTPSNPSNAFQFEGAQYEVLPLDTVSRLRLIDGMQAERTERQAQLLEPTNPAYAGMLRSQAAYLRGSALFADLAVDRAWVTVNHPQLTTVNARTEKYAMFGSPFETKATMQGTVALNDESLSDFLGRVVSMIPFAEQSLAALWTAKGEMPPFDFKPKPIPPMRYVNLIFGGGIGNSVDYVSGGFILPNPGQYSTEIPEADLTRRIILYGTVMASRVEGQGLPVARLLFDETTVRGLESVVKDPIGMALFANTHEIAHATGVRNAEEVYGLWKSGGSNHSIAVGLEEGKADANGLFYLPLYEQKGMLTTQQKVTAYYGYFGNVLRNVFLMNDTHALGGAYHWHLGTQARYNFIVKGTDGIYRFDIPQAERVMPAFVKEYQELMASKDVPRVTAFHEASLASVGPDTDIGKAIAQAKALGGPKMHRPYYIVRNYRANRRSFFGTLQFFRKPPVLDFP